VGLDIRIDADASEDDIAARVAQSQKRSAGFDTVTNLVFQRGFKDRIGFLNQLVEKRLFGRMAFVVWRLARRGIPCR